MKQKKRRSATNMNSVLGPGTELQGKFKDAAGVRADGNFEGELDVAGDVIVGPEAIVNANIRARSLLILGKVVGDIQSQGRVEIGSTGSLTGNVTASDLTIAEGAFFNGECRMSPSTPPPAARGRSGKESEKSNS